MDNESYTIVKEYISTEKTIMQYVELQQHRVNTENRAIQTFKNHFIAGLCTVDKAFPLQLWCNLLTKA